MKITCWEGIPCTMGDGVSRVQTCKSGHCIKHWRRYAEALRHELVNLYHPWQTYIATLPRPDSISDNQFEYIVKKWFSSFSIPSKNIYWYWVRHNDFGHVNYHYALMLPCSIDCNQAKTDLLEIYKKAKTGIRTKHQLYIAPQTSWEGYISYITHLCDVEDTEYPPWLYLRGRVYGISPRWRAMTKKYKNCTMPR